MLIKTFTARSQLYLTIAAVLSGLYHGLLNAEYRAQPSNARRPSAWHLNAHCPTASRLNARCPRASCLNTLCPSASCLNAHCPIASCLNASCPNACCINALCPSASRLKAKAINLTTYTSQTVGSELCLVFLT